MKKFFAFLIILFIGMPILFALIWASGLQKAITSNDFLHELPQKIKQELPELIDNSQNSALIQSNPNTKIWLQALDKSGSSLRKMFRETGITKWMEDEVLEIFQQLEEWIKEGESQSTQDIVIELTPLKNALSSDKFEKELTNLINNLPACDYDQQKEWDFIIDNYAENNTTKNIPSCKPHDVENAVKAITKNIKQKLTSMPPKLHLFSTTGFNIKGIKIEDALNRKKVIDKFIIISFLIPCFFLALGALIGANGKALFLRWFSMPLITCGVFAIACSSAVKNIVLMAIDFPYIFRADNSFPLSEELAAQLYDITDMTIKVFLNSVNNVGSVVAIIGLVIFAVSYTFKNEKF